MEAKRAYDSFMKYITQFSEADLEQISNEVLRVILTRTISFRKVKNSVNNSVNSKYLQSKVVRLPELYYIEWAYIILLDRS